MKHLAVLIAAALTLTLVAPVFAQPFADVPTDHWAYDAIAELAAKGLIEGYPDGAFRGDRAMTRYEMAMVVARLLARIEAIKIPPLPADLVRTPALNAANAANAAALRAVDQRLTAKLATVQRLVAEFRAELAALGVRVTAVEEELAAIRARLDNTKVTGDMRFRYNAYPSNSVSGGGTFRSPDARLRARITFTSQPTRDPNVTAVVRFAANNMAYGSGSLADTRFGNDFTWNSVSFDLLYLDIRNTWAANLWRIGRQYYSAGNPVTFAPAGGGLLFDPADSGGCASAPPFGNWACTPGTIDGLLSTWTLGPLNAEIGLFRQTTVQCTPAQALNPGGCPPVGFSGLPGLGVFNNPGYFDYQVLRVTTGALLPGWTLGGMYYNQIGLGIVPGFWTGGRGYGFDIAGTLLPGLTVFADWANWVTRFDPGPTFTSASSNAWRVGGNINLAQIAGIQQWNPNIDFAYNNFGPTAVGMVPPFFSYASTQFGQFFTWNMRGWLVRLNLTFTPKASAFIHYEGGTELIANTSYYEWWLRFTYRLTPSVTTYIQYTKGNNPTFGTPANGNDYLNFYRAEMSYSW
jgi:hypothetical protein